MRRVIYLVFSYKLYYTLVYIIIIYVRQMYPATSSLYVSDVEIIITWHCVDFLYFKVVILPLIAVYFWDKHLCTTWL